MNIIQSVPFKHEGTNYNIVITKQGDQYVVRAYKDGNEVNGYPLHP